MANIGRFFCVAFPFILTLLSLITLLIATLGGVSNKGLYQFQINLTDLSVEPNSIQSVISRDLIDDAKDKANDIFGSDTVTSVTDKADEILNGSGSGSNVTAADLGLANLYNVNLWGYCMVDASDKTSCTKPRFDWATEELNDTFSQNVHSIQTATGTTVDIPDAITQALSAFSTGVKWTEILFIVALVALGLQILFGIFTSCTRVVSCIVYIISGVSTFATLGAAGLSTAMSVVVVGVAKGSAKVYGVDGHFNTTFLGLVWASFALASAASLFWLFTVCCCAPDHSKRHSKRGSTAQEKLLPSGTGAYQPLHDPEMHGARSSYNQHSYSNSYGNSYPSGAQGPRSDLAYEPFSHR